jgi:hypothetical protein
MIGLLSCCENLMFGNILKPSKVAMYIFKRIESTSYYYCHDHFVNNVIKLTGQALQHR